MEIFGNSVRAKIKINGIKVFSDKEVSCVSNTRVDFADGSWCDVSTGRVVNIGSGYINIGSKKRFPTEEMVVDKETIEGPKVYPVRNLKISEIFAKVEVQVHQADNVEITIIGSADEVKNINVNQQDNTLVVKGKNKGDTKRRGISIVSQNSNINISRLTVIGDGNFVCNGNVSITSCGQSERDQMKIIVKVPKGASVNLSEISGNLLVGDTEGFLSVSTSGNNKVSVGRVASATLTTEGSSTIDVLDVRPNILIIKAEGSGKIQVNDGKVEKLNIEVCGSGKGYFFGQAQTAELVAEGSGNILVDVVLGNLSKESRGSGRIKVNKTFNK